MWVFKDIISLKIFAFKIFVIFLLYLIFSLCILAQAQSFLFASFNYCPFLLQSADNVRRQGYGLRWGGAFAQWMGAWVASVSVNAVIVTPLPPWLFFFILFQFFSAVFFIILQVAPLAITVQHQLAINFSNGEPFFALLSAIC